MEKTRHPKSRSRRPFSTADFFPPGENLSLFLQPTKKARLPPKKREQPGPGFSFYFTIKSTQTVRIAVRPLPALLWLFPHTELGKHLAHHCIGGPLPRQFQQGVEGFIDADGGSI